MPKYTYLCEHCNQTCQKFVSDRAVHVECPRCGNNMLFQMPTLSGKAEVRETVDQHTGVKWQEDQQKIVSDRKREYFWSVEVPRMVNSGVYSIETMLENRWVYYDEKGNLVTRTAPPEAE